VAALASLAALGLWGCSGSDPATGSGSPTGGSAQAAAAGASQAQAGATNAGSSAAAGTGPGTSGSSSTAGASGSSSGGASGVSGSGSGNGNGGSSSGGAGSGTAGTGGTVDPGTLDKFSFFVTSLAAMLRLSKSDKGFGGDLTYGTADGLTGADKICTEIAESSMPGSSVKNWHAFLSTTKVNAKDRIGTGPWYDRTGRLVAQDLTGLLQARPVGDAAIKDDLPNEDGIPNHKPNLAAAKEDDNHHTLTGSNDKGTLYSATATCKDWTTTSTDNSASGAGRPRIGFSWQAPPSRVNWVSGQDEGGCGAGVTGVMMENGGSDPGNPIVGSGGGYGGIYCFALVP